MAIHLRPAEHAVRSDDYGAALRPGERSPGVYAASSIASRGRMHPEGECTTRSPFQRDRDRVLHSTPFRRLTHKTQVFIYHEGDHYRTRLTHSLEVAQIARTVARQLRLDEDLAEALALAHDLGHSPFGHAGERALDAVMREHGGFDHNAQSLRVVTRLERKYLAFDGLNLTWETLEGLAKHNGPIDSSEHAVAKVVARIGAWRSLEPAGHASAEAQVAAVADDIAYVTHDIDDALRAGLLKLGDLTGQPLAGDVVRGLPAPSGGSADARHIYEATRRMITAMIADLVATSRQRLARLGPASPDDIRNAGLPVVAFSDAMTRDITALKSFLFAAVYRHNRVMRVMREAERVVQDLFWRCLADDEAMPANWQRAAGLSDRRRARVVSDYVAGMTDRYALAEHRRLFDATPELR